MDAGAQINCTDHFGHSALHLACWYGCEDVTEMLIKQAGINIDEIDNNGWTALMICAHEMHSSCAKILIDNGANICITDAMGHDAIMMSGYFGDFVTTKLLIDAGADTKRLDKHGRTALDLARKDKIKSILTKQMSEISLISHSDDGHKSYDISSPRSETELFFGHASETINLVDSSEISRQTPFRVKKSERVAMLIKKRSSLKTSTPLIPLS